HLGVELFGELHAVGVAGPPPESVFLAAGLAHHGFATSDRIAQYQQLARGQLGGCQELAFIKTDSLEVNLSMPGFAVVENPHPVSTGRLAGKQRNFLHLPTQPDQTRGLIVQLNFQMALVTTAASPEPGGLGVGVKAQADTRITEAEAAICLAQVTAH